MFFCGYLMASILYIDTSKNTFTGQLQQRLQRWNLVQRSQGLRWASGGGCWWVAVGWFFYLKIMFGWNISTQLKLGILIQFKVSFWHVTGCVNLVRWLVFEHEGIRVSIGRWYLQVWHPKTYHQLVTFPVHINPINPPLIFLISGKFCPRICRPAECVFSHRWCWGSRMSWYHSCWCSTLLHGPGCSSYLRPMKAPSG